MFMVGTGVADIHAAKGIPLGGYWGRPIGGNTGVRDPITARAIAVKAAVDQQLVGEY